MADIKSDAEKAAKEMAKMLDGMGKEMEKAAAKIGKMGEEAYRSLPKEAKEIPQSAKSVFDSVAENLRWDIPKMQKNIEGMAKRLGKYAQDMEKAAKGKK
jgi:F0F1-type ATP synthase membrane subunit b/b'